MVHANLVAVGQLGRTHGLKGEFKLLPEEAFQEVVLEADTLFVSVKGTPVPHFVEYIRGEGTPIIKFEDIDDIDSARSLQGAQLLLPEDQAGEAAISEEQQFAALFTALTGFSVVDVHTGLVGRIESVEEMPSQWMAVVRKSGARQIFIPLHPGLIKDIDEKKQILYMNLPEGLIDL
jgi:16S rRNA processing protein RimM